jgi:GTP pyrophosphokinase
MHEEAEYGVAAHWVYKRRSKAKPDDDEWLTWVRSLMEGQQEDQDPGEYMRSLRTDLFAEEVYVFTPKGEVKVLPSGATPIDFAYAVHTDVGHRTVGAKVNGRIVPLHYRPAAVTSSRSSPRSRAVAHLATGSRPSPRRERETRSASGTSARHVERRRRRGEICSTRR